MLGIQYIKVEPTEFVLQYRGGEVVREGAGLSFFYFAPSSSLVRVPMGSVDVPFIFEEVTADFQKVTVQGQLTYRIANPRALAELMNFTLAPNGRDYSSEDPTKLDQRLINHAQVLTSATLKGMSLREAHGRSLATMTEGNASNPEPNLRMRTTPGCPGIQGSRAGADFIGMSGSDGHPSRRPGCRLKSPSGRPLQKCDSVSARSDSMPRPRHSFLK